MKKIKINSDYKSSLELIAETLKYKKICINNVQLNATYKDDVINSLVTGKIKNGSLKINPILNLRTQPALLTIPENSMILSNAHIDPDFLQTLCPVFKGVGKTDGQVSLKMESFSLPITTNWKNEMKFILDVIPEDVKFFPNKSIVKILTFIRIKNKQLSLKKQQWKFVCNDGRIESKQITVETNQNYDFTVSGYIDMDNSLAYTLAFPLLWNKDKSIDINVIGTIDKPVFDTKEFIKNTKKVVQEEGKKAIEKGKAIWGVAKGFWKIKKDNKQKKQQDVQALEEN